MIRSKKTAIDGITIDSKTEAETEVKEGGVVMNEAAVILANISAELSTAREAVYRDNEMDMEYKDKAISAIDTAFRELDRAYSYLEE